MRPSAPRAGKTASPFAPSKRGATALLVALTIVVVAISLGMGAVKVAAGDVVAVMSRHAGVTIGREPAFLAEAVVWDIRLPRILLGLVAGGGLGLAGVALQGVFRNPMADPQLLGIGPGAALGAAIGAAAGATQGAIAGGTVGGILTALLVKRLSRGWGAEPARFILVGVALGAALTAWVGFVVFGLSDSTKVPPVEFWLLGSFTGSTWRALGTTLPLVAVGGFAVFASARTLDVLALGESDARHLGVDVDLVMTVLLMAVGVMVGASVGAIGVIGFVGLLVPHVVRRLVGPTHRHLLIGSAVAGGLMVVATDLVARIVAPPVEIPVGLVTAAVGGPFFLWLIQRSVRGAPI